MKILSTILFLSILVLNSCSTTKSKELKNIYERCLPKPFAEDLNEFTSSFGEFLNRNYDGQIEKFIKAIVDRKFPDRDAFTSKDFEISNALRQRNFKNYIYTEYKEDFKNSRNRIQPPRTVGDSGEDMKRKMIKVDAKKPYLSCLNSTETKGELIKQYVKLQTNNPSVSPLVIGNLFLVNKNDLDFNTNLTKQIIAVELYYMILDAVTK